MKKRANYSEFEAFIGDFRPRVLAAGISAHVFEDAFENVTALPIILTAQNNQAEFSLSLQAYFARVIPKLRVRTGRENIRKYRDVFNRIEAQLGVGAEIIAAIWGIETDYGRQRGTHSVIASLATLAWAGRRASFFEAELLHALAILQGGHVQAKNMVGSWAGAMGHGQFLPSSFLAHAVDFDGDGRADIWHDDPTDALASIAHYLTQNGWQDGASWGVEIVLPPNFAYAATGLHVTQTVAAWLAQGITLKSGGHPADYGPASVLLPTGATGPAFLVFNNFKVLMSYNNAVPYALAAGMLADQIGGARAPHIDMWPDTPPLVRADFAILQTALTAAGYDAGAADGLQGPDTARAIRAYQKAHGLAADGFASADLLTKLQAG